MEGFIYRVWGKLGIDKIVLIAKGIFIVRFNSFDSSIIIFEDGCFMFDKKFVIV